jgi:hypothetical protein
VRHFLFGRCLFLLNNALTDVALVSLATQTANVTTSVLVCHRFLAYRRNSKFLLWPGIEPERLHLLLETPSPRCRCFNPCSKFIGHAEHVFYHGTNLLPESRVVRMWCGEKAVGGVKIQIYSSSYMSSLSSVQPISLQEQIHSSRYRSLIAQTRWGRRLEGAVRCAVSRVVA